MGLYLKGSYHGILQVQHQRKHHQLPHQSPLVRIYLEVGKFNDSLYC